MSRFQWLRYGSFSVSDEKTPSKSSVWRIFNDRRKDPHPYPHFAGYSAIRFYSDHIISQEVTDFLAPALVSALRATIQGSENRISRLMFKLTVELSMMMHVLAAGLEIDNSQLDDLRWRCVQEVKKTNGGISFKDTLREHDNGGSE